MDQPSGSFLWKLNFATLLNRPFLSALSLLKRDEGDRSSDWIIDFADVGILKSRMLLLFFLPAQATRKLDFPTID